MGTDNERDMNLVVVLRAPNEITANIIHGLLESEGIPAMLNSRMVPWMNGIMEAGEGYWGDVLVPEHFAQRSREIIEDYLAGIEANTQDK